MVSGALASLSYTGAADFNGADTITVAADDLHAHRKARSAGRSGVLQVHLKDLADALQTLLATQHLRSNAWASLCLPSRP